MKVFLQSIQSRLVALIILAILPGLGILIVYSIYDRHIAIENALQQAVITADSIASDQMKIIKDTEVFLSKLSKSSVVLTPESPACSAFLAKVLQLSQTYINLAVPFPNGDVLCNATPLSKPVNVFDRPYFKRALSTKAFTAGEYQIDRVMGIASINFAYPVIHPENEELVGLAVAVLSLDWLQKHISETHLPKHTVAYITDDNKKFIASLPVNPQEFGRFSDSELGSIMEGDFSLSKGTKIIKSSDNHTRVFVSRLLTSSDFNSSLTLNIGVPIDAELALINKRLLIMLFLLLAFAILIITTATYGVHRSILIPIAALIQSAKNLELGKSDTFYPQPSVAELRVLQEQFSTMAKARLNAEQQLKDQHIKDQQFKDNQSLLFESQNQLTRHIENTPLGYISWDINFYCREWNKSAEKMFGYSAEEAIGRHVSELILAPSVYEERKSEFTSLFYKKEGSYSTNRNITRSGNILVCEWHITPTESLNGDVTGLSSLVQDVTKRKKMEAKLTTAASVFGHAREGIIITDNKGVIIDVNKTFEVISGYTRDEVLGRKPEFLDSELNKLGGYAKILDTVQAKGYWDGENWSKRKNQKSYPQLLTISTVYNENKNVKNYVILFSDITLLKQHQTQLEHIAHYDVLTKLPNRTLLADRLKQAIIQSKRNNHSVAVVFIDLDGFKAVNDENGHAVGDELLVTLSHRMKEALRDGDTLSRFGGDEFVVVLVDLETESDCEPILERLLKSVSESVNIGDTVLKVSASIGVTLYPQDKADDGQLIRHADQAMYIAKQRGKNCYYVFDTIFDDAITKKRENVQKISRALKNHELVLYYQPKVNMRTGRVIGVEALIRWQHPVSGLLQPIDFLPMIEDQTISINIGEWVINEALTQITRWVQQGSYFPVSVNIDAQQLQQHDFTTRLESILAQHPSIDPSALQLEILETSAFGDINGVSDIMKQCLELGVKFAIDDFGTGYSSLTYLRRLPADLIKIDKSFVRDMLEDSDDLAIVVGVVGLAASFNREVIAEGVESIAHGTALLNLGCELAQGYAIARPMPANKIIKWNTHWQPAPEWLDTNNSNKVNTEIGSD
ncbi:MAG: diguanylate cyclase (GGDEF)-like protein/PAS domain S-box-containing protein [Oleispira sp.]|jgi:diguanylate cyclase (GGDEF)-like protein/PAS domain S-box-containing protein